MRNAICSGSEYAHTSSLGGDDPAKLEDANNARMAPSHPAATQTRVHSRVCRGRKCAEALSYQYLRPEYSLVSASETTGRS